MCLFKFGIFEDSDDSVSESGEKVGSGAVPGEAQAGVVFAEALDHAFVVAFDFSDNKTFGGSEGNDSEVFADIAEIVQVSVGINSLFQSIGFSGTADVPDFNSAVLLSDKQELSFIITIDGNNAVVLFSYGSVQVDVIIEDSDFAVP